MGATTSSSTQGQANVEATVTGGEIVRSHPVAGALVGAAAGFFVMGPLTAIIGAIAGWQVGKRIVTHRKT